MQMSQSNKSELQEGATTGPTVQKNIETVMELEKSAVESRSAAEIVADKITTFAGSTPFIVLHIIWFGGWILINEGIIPGISPFDPFPFNLLTLSVSLEAIFLSTFILISENRQSRFCAIRAGRGSMPSSRPCPSIKTGKTPSGWAVLTWAG